MSVTRQDVQAAETPAPRAVQLTIDGRSLTASEGQSVLDVALQNGISIPHLCTHPELPAFGACRMCVVQIKGMRGYPSSCTTPVAEGMVVSTDTAELQDLRRRVLELIMLEHPSACLVCEKAELCERYRPKSTKAGRTTGCHTCNNKQVCEVRMLSEQLQMTDLPVPPMYHDVALQRGDPFIEGDLNLCILCGRCVRICKAHQGWGVIDFVGRGSSTHIGVAFGGSLASADCRFCGSCVDVCPTGSLSDRYAKWYGAMASQAETTCQLCDQGCAVKVGVNEYRRAVQAQGLDSSKPLCVLGRFATGELLGAADRQSVPKVRVLDVLREVSWEVALADVAQRLKPFVGTGEFAAVCDTGSTTLEDRRVLERLVREVMGSSHYIELRPDSEGMARCDLPAGVKAVLLLGPLVDPEQLNGVEVVVLQDLFASAITDKAHATLPSTTLAEVTGTLADQRGDPRPLQAACDPPGQARADWRIVCDLAVALGANDLSYDSVEQITAELGLQDAALQNPRSEAPPAALNVRLRRRFFRGHRLSDRVRGLTQTIIVDDSPESQTPARG